MPAPPSASANSTPSKGSYSSGSHSLLPSQTMPFLSSHLITDCHTGSHNCRPCLSHQPLAPRSRGLVCLFFPFCSQQASPGREGRLLGKGGFLTPSQLPANPNSTTRKYFTHPQTRPATAGMEEAWRRLGERSNLALHQPHPGILVLLTPQACFLTK